MCESRINALPYPFGSITESKIRCYQVVGSLCVTIQRINALPYPFGSKLYTEKGGLRGVGIAGPKNRPSPGGSSRPPEGRRLEGTSTCTGTN